MIYVQCLDECLMHKYLMTTSRLFYDCNCYYYDYSFSWVLRCTELGLNECSPPCQHPLYICQSHFNSHFMKKTEKLYKTEIVLPS